MKSLRIPSKNLNSLNEGIKDLINQGVWYLYEYKAPTKNRAYILVANKDVYFLNNNGKIISTGNKEDIQNFLGKSVYFTDIPLPVSLTNLAYPYEFTN